MASWATGRLSQAAAAYFMLAGHARNRGRLEELVERDQGKAFRMAPAAPDAQGAGFPTGDPVEFHAEEDLRLPELVGVRSLAELVQ
jgi:hypothetical protein